jgi:hypothetical protein
MWTNVTRANAIQIWFAGVVVALAWGVVLGASVTASTGALLLALCLAPPVIVLLLWRGVHAPTLADVPESEDRRA